MISHLIGHEAVHITNLSVLISHAFGNLANIVLGNPAKDSAEVGGICIQSDILYKCCISALVLPILTPCHVLLQSLHVYRHFSYSTNCLTLSDINWSI